MLPGRQEEGIRPVCCFARRNPGMRQQPPWKASPLWGEELVFKGQGFHSSKDRGGEARASHVGPSAAWLVFSAYGTF